MTDSQSEPRICAMRYVRGAMQHIAVKAIRIQLYCFYQIEATLNDLYSVMRPAQHVVQKAHTYIN
jgi:hypothetical protein